MSAVATPDARRTWLIGGSLLVATSACSLMASQLMSAGLGGVLGWLQAVLWALALAVFAIGIRGEGSVVARRPLGVIALLVAGILPLLSMLVREIAPPGPRLPQDGDLPLILAYAEWLVPLAALLIAVVVIARAGAVPDRLR